MTVCSLGLSRNSSFQYDAGSWDCRKGVLRKLKWHVNTIFPVHKHKKINRHTHTQYTYDPYVTCPEKCSSKYLRFNGKNPNIKINSDVAIRKKPWRNILLLFMGGSVLYSLPRLFGYGKNFSLKSLTWSFINLWNIYLASTMGKIPWRRTWQPTPAFLPGESHGQKSLAGTVHGVTGHNWSDLAHSTQC